MDTLKSLDLAEYMVFCDDDFTLSNFDSCLLSGDVKIYSLYGDNIESNSYEKNALCEQVVLQNLDVKKYIEVNSFTHVKTEMVNDIKIDYYYCKKLPKRSYCFGVVYNIVIATKTDKTVVGYPCIMGSL